MGVFRRRDLAAWGIDPRSVRTYVNQGLIMRIHHGIYADAGAFAAAREDPVRMHSLLTRAAILALPIRAYAFGPTASLIHGQPIPPGLPETVSLIRQPSADQRALRRRISHATMLGDVHVHRHRLAKEDVTVVDGIPVVTRDIAAVTTAARCTHEWAVAMLDAVSWQRDGAAEDLAAVIENWAQLRGIGTVRAALAQSRTGAQTPFESLSRIRLVAQDLPEPRLQTPFYDDDGLIGYVDMEWDKWRVIGECDGAVKYADRADLIREKVREDRLRALGYAVVRWMWPEMMSAPRAVAARIRRAARFG